jgi:8-oxo-dGTP pyrophosphatase MutT (NUDIX family)
VYALIERDGSILLERRTDAPLWSLIAGRVEADETLVEGLVREVAEETGLVISSFSFFGHYSDPTRIASYADGNVYSLVTFAYVFSKAELSEVDLPATQRQAIEHYVADGTAPRLE